MTNEFATPTATDGFEASGGDDEGVDGGGFGGECYNCGETG
jgi:hypothetical protein